VANKVVNAPLAVRVVTATNGDGDLTALEHCALGIAPPGFEEPLALVLSLRARVLVVSTGARHVIFVLPNTVVVRIHPLAASSQLALRKRGERRGGRGAVVVANE